MTERIDPSTVKTENASIMVSRHIAVYNFAQLFVSNSTTVLDLGCGVGYGSYNLGDMTNFVVGVDNAFYALPAPHQKSSSILFVNALAETLPFQDASFEVVVSLQVIEHIQDDHQYLAEIARVLTGNGVLIISTPNRSLRLFPFQPPTNPYHVREYHHKALECLLLQYFSSVEVRGLQASKELMFLEYERLKQNPFRVYLQMVLPQFMIAFLKGFFAKNREFDPNQITLRSYSPDEFWVSSRNVAKSLDLVAICNK